MHTCIDDIDKTFDALRHIDFHSMKSKLISEFGKNIFFISPVSFQFTVLLKCESLLKEHNWTLDEFTSELNNFRY